jgi:predicted CoA-binding protein
MAFSNPSDDRLRALLTQTRTIAVVGASSDPGRPSHGVMRRLLAAGYRVIPVNPNETEILGQKAYPSLDAVPESIDLVDVFRRSEATLPIAEEAVRKGAKVLWLQLGVVNEDAANRAKAGGLEVVMDRCTAIELTTLRVPGKPSP